MICLFKFRSKKNYTILGILLGVLSSLLLVVTMLQNGTKGISSTVILLVLIYGLVFHDCKKNNYNFMMPLVSIKIILSIIILYIGWIPQLEFGSESWGYDPQRYYLYATKFADSNFNQAVLPPLNYKGIVYYYAVWFKIFGCNPVIPMLINTVTTYISAIYIIKIVQCIYQNRIVCQIRPNTCFGQVIGFFILLPEIFWYDILPARETICMTLVVVSIYSIIQFIDQGKKAPRGTLSVIFISLILLGLIRTSFLMIPILVVAYILIKRKQIKLILTVGIVALSIVGASLLSSSMGSDTGLSDSYERIFGEVAEKEVANLKWNENSIGLKLIGKNIYEKILLLPIRIFVYIIAPLPQITISFKELNRGSWGEWQHLFTVLSSFGYIIALPLFIASLLDSFLNKKRQNIIYVWIPFFISAVAVAGGNIMIHERYRIVFIPYYVLTIITGISSKTCYRRIGMFITLFVFAMGAFIYIVVKY